MLLYDTNHRWNSMIVSALILEGFAPRGKNTGQTLELLKEFIATLAPKIIKPRAPRASER